MSGKLYGVGVGPGDPKLMTYLAVETIKNCPVIAVPADGKEHAISYKRMSGTVFTDDERPENFRKELSKSIRRNHKETG